MRARPDVIAAWDSVPNPTTHTHTHTISLTIFKRPWTDPGVRLSTRALLVQESLAESNRIWFWSNRGIFSPSFHYFIHEFRTAFWGRQYINAAWKNYIRQIWNVQGYIETALGWDFFSIMSAWIQSFCHFVTFFIGNQSLSIFFFWGGRVKFWDNIMLNNDRTYPRPPQILSHRFSTRTRKRDWHSSKSRTTRGFNSKLIADQKKSSNKISSKKKKKQ